MSKFLKNIQHNNYLEQPITYSKYICKNCNAKNKVYDNLVIHHADKEKPSQVWLEAELSRLQARWDADQIAKQERLASVKSKLELSDAVTYESAEESKYIAPSLTGTTAPAE